ncbi:septum formation initiator family protein [Arthrobacter jiangjiafuii]|uniref:Septum formation initiator family protein n=1 Tax=Arthrobacter jiangjiafuii TaxID=2817475 RepID=A0A975R147_9MICC|nr:septum formation initiator family protein [Arthrobacter jiangjiafuii]MBP3043883.1 septum formation initiator family protein [Arthrobacter jiangjiafuii]QWC10892.1 septum formation initiator family protein [Arthrobacter jiangjiafuii]
MSTRRPKVPQARTAGGRTASEAVPAVSSGNPARRPTGADPDTITATKPVGGATRPAARKPATAKSSAEPAAAAAKSSAKTAAAKPSAKEAKTGTPASKPGKATKSGKAPKSAKPGKAAKPGKNTTEPRASRFGRFTRKPAAGTASNAPTPEPSDDLQPVPAKTFSGRLLVLAMVSAVVTVLLAPSVSTYLHQRSEIAALEADIAAKEQSAQELQSQLDRWADPNYIKQQARERIFLVMPGETRYLVKGEHGVENVEQQAQEQETDLQWVDALWDSVTRSAAAS